MYTLQYSKRTIDKLIGDFTTSTKTTKSLFIIVVILVCLILAGSIKIMAQDRGIPGMKLQSETLTPSTFNAFTATPLTGKTYLNWVVSPVSEETNYYIERSTDNLNFSVISVKAAIESPYEVLYSVIDSKAPVGNKYYRIRMVTKSGNMIFSKTKALLTPEREVAGTKD